MYLFEEILQEEQSEMSHDTWHHNSGTGLVDVHGDLDLGYQDLDELPHQFGEVWGDCNIAGNKLTSLKGAPIKVRKNFWCNHNQLTNLIGCPQEIGLSIECQDNKLITLEGAPPKIGRYFYCWPSNNLRDFKFIPSCRNKSDVIEMIEENFVTPYLEGLGYKFGSEVIYEMINSLKREAGIRIIRRKK